MSMLVSSVDYVITTIIYTAKFMCGSTHTSLKYLANESFPLDIPCCNNSLSRSQEISATTI